MVFSGLTKRTVPSHGKHSSRKGKKVERVIFHHWAGTRGGDSRLTNPREAVSCSYIIYSNGDIVGQVPEEYRPWTSGGFAADGNSITFEIQNETNGPEWKVSAKAEESAAKLLADIAKRHKWGGIVSSNTRGHREFQATSCPGPYLWPRLSLVREKAVALLKGKPAPKPSKPKTSGKTIAQLADEVLRGDHGNGDARKKSLGDKYDKVQAEINKRLYGTTKPASKPSKSVQTLAQEVIDGKHGNGSARAKSLGARYNEVQAEVNRMLKISTKPAPKPAKVDITRLAKAVIRGDYGNGAERKRRLGSNYAAVQKEVNRQLGLK